jgi:hypothetical protein
VQAVRARFELPSARGSANAPHGNTSHKSASGCAGSYTSMSGRWDASHTASGALCVCVGLAAHQADRASSRARRVGRAMPERRGPGGPLWGCEPRRSAGWASCTMVAPWLGKKGRNRGEWKGGWSVGLGVNEGEVGRGVLGDVGGRWE